MRIILGLLALLVTVAPFSAAAWGAEGHRLTGHIAQSLLSKQARDQISRLTPDGLASAANYMDINRPELAIKYPASASWHYDDLPVCQNGGATVHCASGNCASAKIEEYLAVLSDYHSSKAQKKEALRFIVHLVGDIHQPLHAATNAGDRGGNLVQIMSRARNAKLHGAWDTLFVRDSIAGEQEVRYAQHLVQRHAHRFTGWRKDSAPRWIQESHEVAKQVTYGKLPGFACAADQTQEVIEVDDDYRAMAMGIAQERITAAGVRIAWLLNRTFGK